MPLAKLEIAPGFNADTTDYGVGAQWVRGDKVRFWQGKPQKLGGWSQKGQHEFKGVCRGMHAWTTNNNVKYVALGTNTHLTLMAGSTFIDITPIRESGTLGTDPFAVVLSATEVTVTDTAHGLSIGDRVLYSGASAGGGITIVDEYTVVTVPSDNAYTIAHTSAATSTDAATGGSSVAYTYYAPIGKIDSSLSAGWGAGAWGDSTWGTARPIGLDFKPARTWSLDNWGEDLIACPRGGEIYVWDTSGGTDTPGVILHSSLSPRANYVFVSPVDRHLVALGSDQAGSGNIDTMLVHWSDQEDYQLWASAATNTAGNFRLDEGSEIISGLSTRSVSLIWTDTALYSMQFNGPPYTFGFELLGTNCGIMGPHARVEVASRVFWWSRSSRSFYMFDGSLQQIPCPVLDGIREDFNFEQKDKVHGVSNTQFNEVWFFYCTADSNEIDAYVVYNYVESIWFTGTIERTSGIDRSIYDYPLMVDVTYKRVYEHDNTVNADGAALTSYIEHGELEAAPGDRMVLVDKIIVDADITGNLDITLYTRKHPRDEQQTKGPYAFSATDAEGKLSIRAKGRQFAIRYGSDAVDDDWRLGVSRINAKVMGGR